MRVDECYLVYAVFCSNSSNCVALAFRSLSGIWNNNSSTTASYSSSSKLASCCNASNFLQVLIVQHKIILSFCENIILSDLSTILFLTFCITYALLVYLVTYLFIFWHRVSLCISGCIGSCSVDQSGRKLRDHKLYEI